MKNLGKTLLIASFLSLTFLSAVPAKAEEPSAESKQTVQLTDQQKKELASLYKDMIEKRKAIIAKYVEYGVMTEEKGKKIMERLDKHYEKLETKGFIPHYHKHKDKHSHHGDH